jgi:hypothetical protein
VLDSLLYCRCEWLGMQSIGQPQERSGFYEPINMLLHAKAAAILCSHRLKEANAMLQSRIENRDSGFVVCDH